MIEFKRALQAKGKSLPQAPVPVGRYHAVINAGSLLFISGQLPFRNGTLVYRGQLGNNLTVKEGAAAAELCALNLLSQIEKYLEHHHKRLKQIIKIEGFICCTESFMDHAEVLDGASMLLSDILLDKAGHVRAVLGCNSLPLGAAVEIAAVVGID